MSIRRSALTLALTAFAAGGPGLLASGAARAEVDEVKECATQYQAAKAADKLNGQPWQDFFADCKSKLAAAPAPAATAPAEAAPAPKAEADQPAPAKTEPTKGEPGPVPAAGSKTPAATPPKGQKHPKHKAQ
jgi:hypothetical protein